MAETLANVGPVGMLFGVLPCGFPCGLRCGVEADDVWLGSGRGRWHAGDIHTLLGPEKTSVAPVLVVGFGFSE